MDEDNERWERFMETVNSGEIEIKEILCKMSDALDDRRERVMYVQTVSLAIAAAAIHAGVEAVKRSEINTGTMTMEIAGQTILPELARLAEALAEAGHDDGSFFVINDDDNKAVH